MIDWFTLDLVEASNDLPEEQMAILSKRAENFLRVGKGLSWAEWNALSPASHAAFLDAANRLEVERCALIGLAASGRDAAFEILAKLDGGKAKLIATMLSVMEQTAHKLEATAA